VLALVAGSLAMLWAYRVTGPTEEDPTEVARLVVRTLSQHLGLLVRFSGSGDLPGCAWTETSARSTCASAPHLSDVTALAELGQRVYRATKARTGDWRALRLRGLWALLEHSDRTARDRSVATLGRALAADPTSAELENDLAAVLLLRGELDDRPGDWVEALELADRAAARGVPEARFNRALALDLLTLWNAAARAWQVVASQSTGPEEARLSVRLAAMAVARRTPPDLGRDLRDTRRRGERALGAWGQATVAGESAAAVARLAEAAAAAQQLGSEVGDELLARAVAVAQAAEAEGHRSELACLASGHAAYESARGAAPYARYGQDLVAADAKLEECGSPFASWARLDLAIDAFYEKELRRAETLLAGVAPLTDGLRSQALEGRVHWIRGLIRLVEGRFPSSERELRLAIKRFEQAVEPTHVVYLQGLLASALENGGDPRAAWRHRRMALAGRLAIEPERQFTVLDELGQSASLHQHPGAQLFVLNEELALSRASGLSADDDDLAAFTLLDRATVLRALGRQAAARRDLARAVAEVGRLGPQAANWERLRGELEVEEALLDAPGSARALAAIDRQVDFFGGHTDPADQVEVLQLLRERAATNQKRGASRVAEEDLARALQLLERQRSGLPNGEQRARFLSRISDVTADLLALLVADGRSEAALELVETSSNRWWSESRARRGSHPDRLRAHRSASGTLALRYAALPDRLLIWEISSSGLELVQRPIPRRQLRFEVETCRSALFEQRPADPDEESCLELSRQLFPPRLATLAEGDRVVIIADALTHDVPFAALRWPGMEVPDGPDRASLLIEHLRLSFAPGVLGEPIAREANLRDRPLSALFVVDPALDPRLHPDLRPLRAARAGAGDYARLYPAATVLIGERADRRSVLAALPAATVLHIDAHGLDVSGDPNASGLLLAPSALAGGKREEPCRADTVESACQSEALLTASDVAGLGLSGLRLVVLASCQSDAAAVADSPELGGLATALLGAGVAQVLTTTLQIDDGVAARFFASFHRCFSGGGAVDACLRNSQLAFIRSGDPALADPRSWSGYKLYDGTWNRRREVD
jgi:CHAT domain-containing protein